MFKGGISHFIIAVIIVLSLVISGCVSAPPQTGTPAPTATPAVTPVATATPAGIPGASVEVLNAPATAEAGSSFEVTWRVNSLLEKNITHTAVHYGPEPKVEPLTLQSYPNLTKPQGGVIPATFSANITINGPGVVYFRAHAIIDTVNYWSPEMTITIMAPSNATSAVTPKVTPTVTAVSYGGGYSY